MKSSAVFGKAILFNLWLITLTLAASASVSTLATTTIRINNHDFKIEVATTPRELEKGLMDRHSLPADHGMLFILPQIQRTAFWMKNTYISLDVIFINAQGIIKWIYPQATPLSEEKIICSEPIKMVLELPGGTAAKLQINIGDQVIMTEDMHSNNKERQALIENAWENRDQLSITSQGDNVRAIQSVMEDLDKGILRVAKKQDQEWITYEWIKKAVLLSFRLHPLEMVEKPLFGYDKVPSKFTTWTADEFEQAGFRLVPGALVRYSAYIERDAVLMPSFTNVGAHVGKSTMVDIWATVGSCAQIGANCHLSAGVIIGGVLEPVQAQPVIVEDDCFIGTQSAVVEGVMIEQGSVIGMGVMLGASTPIVDRGSGTIHYGRVPAYSVVIAGIMPAKDNSGVQTPCAVIVKRVDAKTRSRTAVNELLRL